MTDQVTTAPIAVVVGTRPEIIKLAPVIIQLGPRALVVHSRQHWDANLSDSFFAGAGLPQPDVLLDGIGGRSRAEQIGSMTIQLGDLFAQERPAAVIVQGDTNTTSAAAQAGNYSDIPVVHVEAGLRSYDRAMPEELNRQVVGVLADLHCAATQHNVNNLLSEGVPSERIALTGNTIVEAVIAALPGEATSRELISRLCLASEQFVLATIHRPENTDDIDRLAVILTELASIELPVVLPLHPRTAARIAGSNVNGLLDGLRTIEPVDHQTFLGLARHARLLISDSGGVQEECTVLKKPLIVVRNSTERPEAIEAGFAQRVHAGADIGATARRLINDRLLAARLEATPSPYGDGTAATKIVAATAALTDRAAAPTRAEPKLVTL